MVMERALPPLFDELDDTPTVPGVYIMPEWALKPAVEGDPLLEDPSSWDSDEDTKRFRVVG
jgi:hypothetical protein